MDIVDRINSIVWGPFTIALVLIAGIYHTVKSGFIQLRFPKMLRPTQGVGFRSVTSALAASMGTGNITGCTAAILAGGAGAVFWMWLSSITGMALAYSENRIGSEFADRYHDKTKGPLLYIEKALSKKAAVIYSVCCLCAAVCMGCMSQSGAMCMAVSDELPLSPVIPALFCALLTGIVIFSSEKASRSCMNVTERLVPFMGVLYGAGCILFLLVGQKDIASAFGRIFTEAFSFRAVSGGTMGMMISVGLRRGIFSNEAGMGSSVLVHSEGDFASPETSGAWAAFEVFLDTIVCCTLTALVILTSGSEDLSAVAAFESLFGSIGGIFICICVCLFAWAAILGWCCYGEKCLCFLTSSEKGGRAYKLIFAAAALAGGILPLKTVFGICDIINCVMMFINLVAITVISMKNLR